MKIGKILGITASACLLGLAVVGLVHNTLLGILGLAIWMLATQMMEWCTEEYKPRSCELKERESGNRYVEVVGQRGVTISDLRPMGEVRIEGNRYQARSCHGFIEHGKSVEVIEVKDGVLVVLEQGV